MKLTQTDKMMTHMISKIRCRMEPVIDFMAKSVHEITLRFIGKKAEKNIGVRNLIYSMVWYFELIKKSA